jgi:hypothetical protein
MNMKKTKITYWILTVLFAVYMALTALPDILRSEDALKVMRQLGYPDYFTPFIGYAKLLGAIAVLIPGYPRIKEWAYAGLVFDLVGATYSIIGAGMFNIGGMLFMLLSLALAFASYFLYHKKLKLEILNA